MSNDYNKNFAKDIEKIFKYSIIIFETLVFQVTEFQCEMLVIKDY